MKLGFNTKGNSQTSGRTTQAVDLGYLRNGVASTTRKYNYCKRTSSAPFYCLFNLPLPPPSPVPPLVDGNIQTIGCSDGNILMSTDGGDNFSVTLVSSSASFYCGIVSTNGKTQSFFDNSELKLYRYENLTNSWVLPTIPPTFPGFAPPCICSSYNGQTQTLCNNSSGDYGRTFNTNDVTPYAFALSSNDSGKNQVAISAVEIGIGVVQLSTDYGLSWNNQILNSFLSPTVPPGYQYAYISGCISGDSSVICIGTFEGIIVNSYDLGITWSQPVATTPGGPIGEIACSYDGNILVATNSWLINNLGQLFISTNKGLSFTVTASGATLIWTYIAVSKSGSVIVAIGNDNSGTYYYYKSVDKGINWSYKELGYPLYCVAIN